MNEPVDIIIRSWNAVDYTLLTVKYLRRNTQVPYRIFIVDDGSNHETLNRLRRLKYVRLIEHGKNLGGPQVALSGFAATKSKVGVMMDNDVLVPKGWLKKLLEYFNVAGVGLVAPLKQHSQYLYPGSEKTTQEVWNAIKKEGLLPKDALKKFLAGETLLSFGRKLTVYNHLSDTTLVAPPGFVSGCCLIFNRQAVQKVGGLAATYLSRYGGDDVDLCWRLGNAGYKVIKSARVYVHHFQHSSMNENRLSIKQELAKNNFKLFRKWGKIVLAQEQRLLEKLGPVRLERKYPFLSVFRKIKQTGKVEVF